MSKYKLEIIVPGGCHHEIYDTKDQAYQALSRILEQIEVMDRLNFEIWSTLNTEFQMEQVGFFLTKGGKGPVHQAYMDKFFNFRGGESSSIRKESLPGWYPSISYEQFIQDFSDPPHAVMDIMGRQISDMIGQVKWKVITVDGRITNRLPPGLGLEDHQS
jgi:hypothetical protein